MKAINQTLTADRIVYNRDFFGKPLSLYLHIQFNRSNSYKIIVKYAYYFSVVGVQFFFLLMFQLFVVIRIETTSKCHVTRRNTRAGHPLAVRECASE